MGSELVSDSLPLCGSESENGSAPVSYTEQFYEYLPFYLAIGMTFDQYWNDDCTLVKYYRAAYEIKRKQRNQELWLQGLYVYDAMCDVSPILQSFAKRGTKPNPYPNKPYPLTIKEIEEEKNREERLRVDNMKSKVAAWAAKTNIQMAKKAEEEVTSGG